MDLVSDVLRDLRLSGAVVGMNKFRAPWGIDKPKIIGAAPFHIIVDGRCLFAAPGGELFDLNTGDMVIVCHGDPHGLQADRTSARVPISDLLQKRGVPSAWNIESRISQLPRNQFGGSGPATTVLSGLFTFGNTRRNSLLASLPPVIHVKVALDKEPGSTGVHQLIAEAESGRPGFQSIAERMAEVLFIQAVRDYVTTIPDDAKGWLRGLADPQIALVLSLVHSSPSTEWTIASLAKAAGLSRTVLANRFRTLIGTTVMAYVTSQRMAIAADMLTTSDRSLAEIAHAVGYESEISFNRAFREWAGLPPGRYRRQGGMRP